MPMASAQSSKVNLAMVSLAWRAELQPLLLEQKHCNKYFDMENILSQMHIILICDHKESLVREEQTLAADVRKDRAALNAFANALCREWPAAELVAWRGGGWAVRVPLNPPAGVLWLPLSFVSMAGRHRFEGAIWWECRNNWAELEFARFVDLLLSETSLLQSVDDSPGSRRLFLQRVSQSADNIAAAECARREDMQALEWPKADYLAAEQGLIYGHSVHPSPKSRDEFDQHDGATYSPDMAGSFALVWFALQRSACWRSVIDEEQAFAQIEDWIQSDPDVALLRRRFPVADGWTLLPVHPWQAKVLRKSETYLYWQRRGALQDLGEVGRAWFPTSSLRTLYGPHAAVMLKFSLSVRLTNSFRVLQLSEVERGRVFHGVLHSSLGYRLRESCPSLRVMHERVAMGLRGPDGSPLCDSLVILRDNPFVSGASAYVMATLCQDGVNGEFSMVSRLMHRLAADQQRPVGRIAQEWFARFLQVAVTPLVLSACEFGLLFSAHAQNTVLSLDSFGWPAQVWFRDCQGTTFRVETVTALQAEVPGIEAALDLSFDEQTANHLLGYYLVVNNFLGLVTALAADGVCSEDLLLTLLRGHLRALREQSPRYPQFLDYLLESDTLMAKGNLMISVGNLNETTSAHEALRTYVPLPNPLHVSQREEVAL